MGTEAGSQEFTCSGSDASHLPLAVLRSVGARLGPLLELTVLRSGAWVLGKAPGEEAAAADGCVTPSQLPPVDFSAGHMAWLTGSAQETSALRAIQASAL